MGITRFLGRKTRRMSQKPFLLRGSGSVFTALVALFGTLCCVGFPALVGVLAALGAGFLVSDRYLEPLVAAALLLTVVIAGLHLRRHHHPGPFILSLMAGGSTFFALYGIRWLSHAPSLLLAYGAILVLLAAQVWDLWLYRRCTSTACIAPETRKEGI